MSAEMRAMPNDYNNIHLHIRKVFSILFDGTVEWEIHILREMRCLHGEALHIPHLHFSSSNNEKTISSFLTVGWAGDASPS